jgi:hypothetical protein
MLLRPVNVEQLIPDDHPARAIWELAGRLDRPPFHQAIAAVEGVPGPPVRWVARMRARFQSFVMSPHTIRVFAM